MDASHRFIVLVPTEATEREFVTCWARHYPNTQRDLYESNIGRELTRERILRLFEWKNGGEIAKHKRESIQRNYIDNTPTSPGDDRESQVAFILQPGGVIWRIFWLHCYRPDLYPIFDQHVYRAMARLKGTKTEIPVNNQAKAVAYVDQYLPFHASFKTENKKNLDKALWAYGKHMKGRDKV